ncbi:tripartite motif-containing protein 46 [Pelomyxa schiedti]|nr:tripartite motif-containing protein 46 [Pelomyxa schiedti]
MAANKNNNTVGGGGDPFDGGLTCSVCIGLVTDPVTLPWCTHTVCRLCAGTLLGLLPLSRGTAPPTAPAPQLPGRTSSSSGSSSPTMAGGAGGVVLGCPVCGAGGPHDQPGLESQQRGGVRDVGALVRNEEVAARADKARLELVSAMMCNVCDDSGLKVSVVNSAPPGSHSWFQTKAVVMCQLCEAPFCAKCFSDTHKGKMKSHTTVPVTAELSAFKPIMCREHNEPCKIWCKDDSTAVCYLCVSLSESPHRGHTTIATNQAALSLKKEFAATIASLSGLIENCHKRIAELTEMSEAIEKQRVDSKKEISLLMRGLVEMISSTEKRLLDSTDQHASKLCYDFFPTVSASPDLSTVSSIDEHHRELASVIEQAKTFSGHAEKVSSNQDDSWIMSKQFILQRMMETLNTLTTIELPEVPPPTISFDSPSDLQSQLKKLTDSCHITSSEPIEEVVTTERTLSGEDYIISGNECFDASKSSTKQYRNVVVQSGATLTVKPWDGSSGGSIHIKCSTFTVRSGGIVDVTGKGYRGGVAPTTSGNTAPQGESSTGIGCASTEPNGGGGGGGVGSGSYGSAGGGGGGYGARGKDAAPNTGNRMHNPGGKGGNVVPPAIINNTLPILGSGGGAGDPCVPLHFPNADSNSKRDTGTAPTKPGPVGQEVEPL